MHCPNCRVTLLVAAFALLVAPALTMAQDGPHPRPLGEPTARSTEAFTYIFDAAELPDGRVLITDSRERTIAIIDLRAGVVERLGRNGEGPYEFRTAFSILPTAEGEYLVYDARLRRFMPVSAGGELGEARSFPRPPLSGHSVPRGPDTEGYVYVDTRTLTPGEGLDREAVIYRIDPRTGLVDSVTSISNYAEGQGGPGIVPMARGDAYTIGPDGSVGRVSADDYRIEWIEPNGDVRRGSPVPHPRIRVDDERRDAWYQSMRRPGNAAGSLSGGGGSNQDRNASARRTRREIQVAGFPEFVPAFPRGYVPSHPDGAIWLRSDVLSGDSRTVFDVIDRYGALRRRVSVPGHARVVGFGSESVYIARKNDLDLERLERYPLAP